MDISNLDRIKESFVRQLESAGLISISPAKHVALNAMVDQFASNLLAPTQETISVHAANAKLDVIDSDAGYNDTWLNKLEKTLPDGWHVFARPSTFSGAGERVFPHYELVNGNATLVAGVLHIHLVKDEERVDVAFKPVEGYDAFEAVALAAIKDEEAGFEEAQGSGPGDDYDWTEAGDGTGYPEGYTPNVVGSEPVEIQQEEANHANE